MKNKGIKNKGVKNEKKIKVKSKKYVNYEDDSTIDKKNNIKSNTYLKISKPEKERNPGDFQESPKSERKMMKQRMKNEKDKS